MMNEQNIRKNLIQFAKENSLDIQKTIDLYVRESLLDRISRSEIGNKFVLKGASVFQVLQGKPHRPTKDIDLLCFGDNNPEAIKAIFTDICQIDLGDGIIFDKIETDILQKGKKYQGVRLNIGGSFENVPIKTQIDIGYGHIITPEAIESNFPTLLNRTPPKLKTYPLETIVAEKLEAIVSLGLRNSRLKDYYDLLYILRNFTLKGEIVEQAIQNTFNRRQTPIPQNTPVGLTNEYVKYRKTREKEWKKLFAEGTMGQRIKLEDTVAKISNFASPLLKSAALNENFSRQWNYQKESWQVVRNKNLTNQKENRVSSADAEKTEETL